MWFFIVIGIIDIVVFAVALTTHSPVAFAFMGLSIVVTIIGSIYAIGIARAKRVAKNALPVRDTPKYILDGHEVDSVSLRDLCEPFVYFCRIFACATNARLNDDCIPDFLLYAFMKARFFYVTQLSNKSEEDAQKYVDYFDSEGIRIISSEWLPEIVDEMEELFETRVTAYEHILLSADTLKNGSVKMTKCFQWYIRNCLDVVPFGWRQAIPYNETTENPLPIVPPITREEETRLVSFEVELLDIIGADTQGLINWITNELEKR